MDVSGHIVRRGVDYLSRRDDKPEKVVIDVPSWVLVMIFTTVMGFLFVMVMIDYTFGRLIPTLLIVESPDALFEPLPTIDPDSDAPLDPNNTGDAERVAVKQQAITSSFRKTIKLLHSKGGFPARFRGFSIYIVTELLLAFATATVAALPFVPSSVGVLVATVVLANFAMAWTHIVISEPSPKRWYRRIPSMHMWKKIAVPTAILAFAKNLAVYLPILFGKVYHFDRIAHSHQPLTGGRTVVIGLEGLSVLIFGLVLALVFALPANVILTRMQASLLDDSEETIVPFDRSFGGKVVPEIVGGTGIISMRDAWTTFDWASRIRLVKAYVKVVLMQFIVTILFFVVMAVEIFVIANLDLKKIMPGDGDDGDI